MTYDDKIDTDKAANLHELLTNNMLEVMRNGRDVMSAEGVVVKVMATAADFNAVRQFLRDNKINSPKSVNSPLNELVSEMSGRGLKFRNHEIKKAI